MSTLAPDPSPDAPDQQWTDELTALGMAFRRVFRTLNRMRGRDTHLGGSELSHAQFELLIELDERGELPAGELAIAARLAPGTVTQMLDHLADSGHVERVRSETDRRVVVSRLTAQGRRKIQAKREAWKSRWELALAGVESSELSAATRVLERLGTVFEDAPPAAACDAPPAEACDAPPAEACDAPPAAAGDAPPAAAGDAPPAEACDAPPAEACDAPPAEACDAPELGGSPGPESPK